MPTGGERDARVARTRSRIKRALTELMAERGFEAVTVSDVTRRAGINRGTFYLHFIDKYDLLGQLEGEVIAGLEQILLAPGGHAGERGDLFPHDRILAALSYVADDFAFVSAIAGRGGDAQFSPKLKRVIGSLLDQGLAAGGLRVSGDETYPPAYAREIVLGHVMAIIDLWLARGGRESPEQVAAMICSSKDRTPASFVA